MSTQVLSCIKIIESQDFAKIISSLCSAGVLLHPHTPGRFMRSLWDFQKLPLCLKGALCSNKSN